MGGTQQEHFLLSVYLMLFFFSVSTLEQLAYALHWTAVVVGGDGAQAAYLLFSGVAVGMMRGMAPDKP
jgi:hypothetical protein